MTRVHLLALPNAETTKAYCLDGFASMTIRFATLLKRMGVHVTLYAGEANEAPCDEHVTVITREEQTRLMAGQPYQMANIHPENPLWQLANPRMIAAIGERKQPRDLICTIGGGSQMAVTMAHPELLAVEYSIGYIGNYAPYRVFESRAWQHMCYGAQGFWDGGRFYDAVIPAFFDEDQFEFVQKPEPYLLYVGRYIPKKGIAIACQAAKQAGMPIKFVGHGAADLITYGENVGAVDEATRNALMANATALICPTVYVEPYGCISPEAQLCGTPVISTDFGGFTETVEHGKTGFRCNLLGQFVEAIKRAPELDRRYIRYRALQEYSMKTAVTRYGEYFKRLDTLWADGWNTLDIEL